MLQHAPGQGLAETARAGGNQGYVVFFIPPVADKMRFVNIKTFICSYFFEVL